MRDLAASSRTPRALKPFAYRPVEFCFPSGDSFKHFDMKWKDYEAMSCIQCEDDALSERLEDMSRKLFLGLNGTGYGRCDIRLSDQGELYMLEINPNCDVAYPLEGSAGSADLLMNERGSSRFLKIIRAVDETAARGIRMGNGRSTTESTEVCAGNIFPAKSRRARRAART